MLRIGDNFVNISSSHVFDVPCVSLDFLVDQLIDWAESVRYAVTEIEDSIAVMKVVLQSTFSLKLILKFS